MRCSSLRALVALVFLLSATSVLGQNVVRGPYLQQQTDGGIIIRWRTDVATESVVRYGLDSTSLGSSTSISGTRTDHSVALTGLTTETKYYYSVGDSIGPIAGDTSYYFHTAPLIGAPTATRFWAIGDSGTAVTHPGQAASVRDAFKTYSINSPADFMLMLGDNAYNDGTDSEYQSAVFDTYPELLRQIPVWSTLGNHDGHSADSATQTGPYYNIFEPPKAAEVGGYPSGTEAYYSFDYGDVHFVCLDSYDSPRGVNGSMMTWLESDLADNDKTWVIAFWHHPPYSKGSHNSDSTGEVQMTEMRQNFLPVLEAWGVDLVLTGHSHSYERSFLLDGHYGLSSSLDLSDPSTHVLDWGDGSEAGNGAYQKSNVVAAENEGAVYVVAGSSGKISGGTLNHPAMFVGLNNLGSMVVDVAGNRLDAVFIDENGLVRDEFTLLKTPDLSPPLIVSAWAEDGNHVIVDFSEPLDTTSASVAANYDVSGLSISGVELLAGNRSVRLTISTMTPGSSHTVTVNNVMDEAGNPILPNSQYAFDYIWRVTQSFQDGVAPMPGYDGTSDSYIREASATTNYGADPTLQVDGDEPSGTTTDMSVVLRWDVFDIPATAIVDSVRIKMNTLNVGGPYSCFALWRDWNQAEVTWNQASSGNPWGTPGAEDGSDRLNLPLCTFSASSTGPITIELNPDGVAIVQSWVDGLGNNYGLIIADSVSTNGADFDSSESATVTSRPRLEISYTMPLVGSNQPPGAYFVDNCTDLDCSFTDLSTDDEGPIVGWSWDFGDGNSSVQQHPDHSYAAAGTYTVILIVTDEGGLTGHASFPVTVTAPNQPPTAGFTVNCTDLDCDFTDTSTDSDGSIAGWSWDFGDGNSSTAQNPNHVFSADGSYNVNLTATDNDSASDSFSDQVTVSLTVGGGVLEVMSWVPVYAIAQSQAAAQADFGNCDAADGLSRVGLQFWTPNSDGSIKYADHEFYTPVDADVTWWKNWGSSNDIEIYLTIYNNTGSWDWALARSAFATNRAAFVAALIAELDRLGLDGIDLDLEGIDGSIIASDRADFDQFVHDLYLQTSARGKGLTINSFPYIWNAPNQDWWGDWVGEVDNIHSMGYQELYQGGTGWNQYSFQQNTGIAAGHSAETVSMGMPSSLATWGTTSGRGTTAQAHVQEIRYDLAQPTGIAIWDLQLTSWQNSDLWCEIATLKNSGVASVPDAPGGLGATVYSGEQIDLSWLDNSANEDGFKVERSPNGASSWVEVASLGTGTTTYSDSGLNADTTWYYRVYAHNVNGNSGYSNVSNATTFTVPRTIQFSGRSWTVKSSASPVGPGPNYFGNTSDDVWIDGNGYLHMKIVFRDGNWHSSEVIGDDVLGHGTYTFTLDSRVDLLDRNIVVGLFTWDTSAPEFNYREIDIEFSRWGDPLADNSQFAVQPWDTTGNTLRWNTVLTGTTSTHAFEWRPDRVEFSSNQGSPPGAVIQSWTYSGADVPPEGVTSGNARINFWLMGGTAPFDGQEAELVVQSFDFTPLPVNNPPTAGFTQNCANLDCDFFDSSSDSDGSIASWAWDFDDGGSSTAQNPSHSFVADGSYAVELTVTDNEGATDVTSGLVTVSTPPLFTDVVMDADIPGAGTVSGAYTATRTDNGTAQSIRERESGGKKSSRHSFLTHTWLADLPANVTATVHANAWSGGSSDDNFVFSWSTDNNSYTELFTVSSTSPANEQSATLPEVVVGPIYIRVEDSDQTPGNRSRDTVFVDHLYIRAESGAGDPPAAPSGLIATVAGSSQIDLIWMDNASDETGFKIERSEDGVNFSALTTRGADVTTHSDGGLTASTTYWYRVSATNASGDSAWSNTDNATTDAPPPVPLAPTAMSASSNGSSSIDLGWVDNSNNEQGFVIERSTDNVNFESAGNTGANVTVFADTGLTAGTTYWYRVYAYNATGDSAYSNTDFATTDAGPAISLALNGYKIKGKHTVDLSWSGTTTTSVEIFRDGASLAVVTGTSSYTDSTTNKGGRTYDYQVCEVGTANCSDIESVTF